MALGETVVVILEIVINIALFYISAAIMCSIMFRREVKKWSWLNLIMAIVAALIWVFRIKILFALLEKTRIDLPLLLNSSIKQYFLIYRLILKFKRDLKLFISRSKKFGLGREVKNLILNRIRRPITFEFLKNLFP